MTVEQRAMEVEVALRIKWHRWDIGRPEYLGQLDGAEIACVWFAFAGRWYAECRAGYGDRWRSTLPHEHYATRELAQAAAIRAYVAGVLHVC